MSGCSGPVFYEGMPCSEAATCPADLVCGSDNRCWLPGRECASDADCQSGVCEQSTGVCLEPRCDDGVQNGAETDIDCGGPCLPCDHGEACDQPSDCLSEVCMDNICHPPVCGDGVLNIDAGEACDDGNDDNSDDCLTNCQVATCGDGFVHTGVEQCDDGDTDDTNACSNSCTLNCTPGMTLDDASLTAPAGGMLTVDFASSCAPFTITFEDAAYRLSTPAEIAPGVPVSAPSQAGLYRAQIRNSMGEVAWLDLTVANASAAAPTPGVSFDPGGSLKVRTAQAGDYDGNGTRDLLVAFDNLYRLYENDGTGDFSLAASYAHNGMIGPQFRDLDGDDDLDIVFLDRDEEQLCTQINHDSGSFAPIACTAIPNGPGTKHLVWIEHIDLDQDGNREILVFGEDPGEVFWKFSVSAAGVLGTPSAVTVPGLPFTDFRNRSTAVADLDGDGLEDLVGFQNSWNSINGRVFVLFNDGQGGFSSYSELSIATGTGSEGVCLFDYDNNGTRDILINRHYDGFEILSNEHDASFISAFTYSSRHYQLYGGYSSRCIDYDGQGGFDYVAGYTNRAYNDGNWQGITVNYNSGGGSYAASELIFTSHVYASWAREYILVEDFNSDGLLDVFVGSGENGQISLIMGN